MHGRRSLGPRTPESRVRVHDARTIHGGHGAEARAENRFCITVLRINRVTIASDFYHAHLPPAFAAATANTRRT